MSKLTVPFPFSPAFPTPCLGKGGGMRAAGFPAGSRNEIFGYRARSETRLRTDLLDSTRRSRAMFTKDVRRPGRFRTGRSSAWDGTLFPGGSQHRERRRSRWQPP